MNSDHFTIFYDAPDYERDVAFYRDTLGLPIVSDYDDGHKRGTMFAVNEAATLELMGAPAGQAQHKPPPTGVRIKFRVADVDVLFERLRAQGAQITEALEARPWGERSFGLRAPDGMLIYVYTEV